MSVQENPEDRVRDVGLVALEGARMSSVGVMVDAMALVAEQVARQFGPVHGQPMQTRLRLLGLREGTLRLGGGRELLLDGGLVAAVDPLRLVYLPAFDEPDEARCEERLRQAAGLVPWLQRQRAQQALFGASGTAVLLLAEAGLLDGGRAAVQRSLVPLFRRRYPRIRVEGREAVVEHDGVFTTATPSSEWALMTRVLQAALSPHMGRWLGLTAGLRRAAGADDGLADDPLVASAQFWLGERFAEPDLRIETLARLLAVSHTTLVRRFVRSLGMTPRHYLCRLRMESAQRMLETTRRPVQQVALMVGYADTRAFRAVFRKTVGASPQAWRTEHAPAARGQVRAD